ncbi:Hypothetical predicted protein [Paramuricea clavata]|uniref:Uncharacterized protein n=1 Tax=Paramuricea clavata TaxID=317549 RepID=A0A7D9K9U4_PARCT|nr:Hypothetical predicted protein [Paramuricea clavata]
MFYKHNSFSGRLSSAEPFTAYQPQVLTELRPEIPRPVMASSGSTGSFSIANRTSNILKYQKLFQVRTCSKCLYLKILTNMFFASPREATMQHLYIYEVVLETR